METINFEIKVGDLHRTLKDHLDGFIKESLHSNETTIKEQIHDYFKTDFFKKKLSSFQESFDWAVEQTFRKGIEKAMLELDFIEVVASKAKEILSDNDFITTLADAKIRASLGLPK